MKCPISTAWASRRTGASFWFQPHDGFRVYAAGAWQTPARPVHDYMGYAVHPHDATMVVLATDGGLFLSSNNGDSFERIGPAGVVTAASFSPDGQHLYFGSSLLSRYDLASKEVLPMQSPPLAAEDTIGYVAVNPVNPHEVAVATLWPGHFPLHR